MTDPDAPRRIAIFVKNLPIGGVQKVVVQLANGFVQRGLEVDLVVAKGGGAMAKLLEPAVNLVDLRVRRMWSAASGLRRYIRQNSPDALLSAGIQENVLAVWGTAFLSTTRLVLSVHTDMSQFAANAQVWYSKVSSSGIRLFYGRADAIIAASKGIWQDLIATAPGLKHKSSVVYNPVVDESLRQLSREYVEHPWFSEGEDIPVILGIGRMDPPKNFELLLRAVARVAKTREVRLCLIGDGIDRKRLESITRDLEIEDRVLFAGFERNPYKYMANASLLVMPSRFEGFGLVLVEAMACGCPVVSTDCPSGPREILEDGRWGRLVPLDDVDALAQAIEESLDSEEDPQVLRRRAEDFSVDRAVDGYLEILLEQPALERVAESE